MTNQDLANDLRGAATEGLQPDRIDAVRNPESERGDAAVEIGTPPSEESDTSAPVNNKVQCTVCDKVVSAKSIVGHVRNVHKIIGRGKDYSRTPNPVPEEDSTSLTLEETEEESVDSIATPECLPEDSSSTPESNPVPGDSLPTPTLQKSLSESVRVSKGILKARDVIGYKAQNQNKYVEVIGRAGKASGKHSSYWNVRNVETGEKFSVNVKGLQLEHVGTLEGEQDDAFIVRRDDGKRTKINGSLLEVEFPLRENEPVQLVDGAEDGGTPEQDPVEGPRDHPAFCSTPNQFQLQGAPSHSDLDLE